MSYGSAADAANFTAGVPKSQIALEALLPERLAVELMKSPYFGDASRE